MEEIDLSSFFKFVKSKILLISIIFITTLLAGNAYFFFLQQPEYQSYSTIILSSDESAHSITQNDVALNKNLAASYAEVIKSRRILDQVASTTNYGYDYEDLLEHISITSIDDASIIKITVTDSAPEKSQILADSIAEYFVKEIPALYKVKNVHILDYAIVDPIPSNKNLVKSELIYAVIGLVLAGGIVFLIFYFDRTIRTPEQVEQITGLPVISKIRKTVSSKNLRSELILRTNPKSNISEDIRTTRTSLQFILNGEKSKIALITSSVPKEGKSFVSANLAIAFAETGKKTLLIDSDLRLGRAHKIFGISNQLGLSNLLAAHSATDISAYRKSTKIKNLDIITRGTVPPNPSELLNSEDMSALLDYVRTQYDIIILDGAPINGLADSLSIAPKADRVFLVCASGDTDSDELASSTKSLQTIGASLSGIILNKITPKSRKNHSYGEYYTKTL